MSKYGKLGKNVMFITIGNFASKILSFLMVPFYTTILSTAEFGTADLMTTTVNLLMPFFTLLISESLLRFSLDNLNDKVSIFTTGCAILILGTSVFFLLSPILLQFEEIKEYYLLFVAYYVVVAFHSALSYFVRGIDKVAVFSVSGVLQTLSFLGLNIFFLAVVKTGVRGYLLSMVLSNVIAILFLFCGAKLNRYINPNSFDWRLLKNMLQYSYPMIPNSLSWWVSNSSDKYMLTIICGVSLTGIYSVSQRIPSLFATISTIFMGAWQISAVEDFGSKESEEFFSTVYKCYSTFNIIIVSVLMCATKFLASILFAKDFYVGWKFVPILLLAFLFHGMSSFLGSVYTSAKKTRMLLISTLVAAVINIVFNFLLIPLIGGYGAAIATLISYFVIWIVRLVYSKKILRINWNKKSDILSYVLLLIQAFVLIVGVSDVSEFCSWGIFAFLILVNKNEITKIYFKVINKLKNRI